MQLKIDWSIRENHQLTVTVEDARAALLATADEDDQEFVAEVNAATPDELITLILDRGIALESWLTGSDSEAVGYNGVSLDGVALLDDATATAGQVSR